MKVYEVWNVVGEYRDSAYVDKGRAEEKCQRLRDADKEQGYEEEEWFVTSVEVIE